MVEDSNFEDDQLNSMSTDDIVRASRLLDNEIRILKVFFLHKLLVIWFWTSFVCYEKLIFLGKMIKLNYCCWSCNFGEIQEELQRTNLELDSFKEKIKENQEKIKLNKQLPYLVGNIVEVIFILGFFSFNVSFLTFYAVNFTYNFRPKGKFFF